MEINMEREISNKVVSQLRAALLELAQAVEQKYGPSPTPRIDRAIERANALLRGEYS
jgi:hypothetical protein